MLFNGLCVLKLLKYSFRLLLRRAPLLQPPTVTESKTDTEDRTTRDEEAADVSSPQGRFGDPQPAAARGEDGSAARGDDDAAARDDDGFATRGDDDAAAHGKDGSTTRGFPRPAKGRETRAFGGLGWIWGDDRVPRTCSSTAPSSQVKSPLFI